MRAGDGAICEMEESLPFTVDDYPLLENWPNRRRRFLGSEQSRIYDDKVNLSPRENEADIADSPDPLLRGNRGDSNSFYKSETSFLEPQVVLIKGE